MSGVAPPSYDKYPVVGDASVVRRVFAFVIDAIFLFVAYLTITVPAWSLAPDWLAFPINIAETQVLREDSVIDQDATVTVREIQVDYFSLSEQLDSCRFEVTTRQTPGRFFTSTETRREPLAPCAYLARFDFGLWFEILMVLFYAPLLEGSRPHATVGKMALALQVRRKDGGEVGFARAFARNVAEALCLLTVGLGYLVALFTTRRQALHDLLTGTVVVER